jgi:periplasmic divalent cation tolerance protein
MNFEYVVVFITVPDEETGCEIARELLSQNLAACVNITSPIRSLYWWDGEVCNDAEVLLIVKTRSELFQEQVVPVVKRCHPYEVPEIIALPIMMGSVEYLSWIKEETQG